MEELGEVEAEVAVEVEEEEAVVVAVEMGGMAETEAAAPAMTPPLRRWRCLKRLLV